MFLEIPSKLEQYVDDIKNQTKYITPSNKIVLLRVGSSLQKENRKIMFLIYNPFAIDIDIDCNFFTNESQIFKLYPAQFRLKPNTAHAFIAFTTNMDGNVEVDEQKYIMHLRNKIFRRLAKLNNIKMNDGYKNTHIYNIGKLDYKYDETIYLGTHNEEIKDDVSSTKFNLNLLDVKIEDIKRIDDKFKVTLAITNNDLEHNFHASGYNVKFLDNTNMALINIKHDLILKSMTQKKFEIEFLQNELANFNIDEMKVKLVFI